MHLFSFGYKTPARHDIQAIRSRQSQECSSRQVSFVREMH
jgi:hypothetical protein